LLVLYSLKQFVTASGSLVSCYCSMATAAQFGILPLQVAVWYPATAAGQQPPSGSCHCILQVTAVRL
jgi:hypothetical protein